jgi:hypothetical protein
MTTEHVRDQDVGSEDDTSGSIPEWVYVHRDATRRGQKKWSPRPHAKLKKENPRPPPPKFTPRSKSAFSLKTPGSIKIWYPKKSRSKPSTPRADVFSGQGKHKKERKWTHRSFTIPFINRKKHKSLEQSSTSVPTMTLVYVSSSITNSDEETSYTSEEMSFEPPPKPIIRQISRSKDRRVPVSNPTQFARNLTKFRRVLGLTDEESRQLCIHYANHLQKYNAYIRPNTDSESAEVSITSSSEGTSSPWPTTTCPDENEEAVVIFDGNRLEDSRDHLIVYNARGCIFHGTGCTLRNVHDSSIGGEACLVQGNDNHIFGEDCDIIGVNNIIHAERYRVYGGINRLAGGQLLYGICEQQ